MTATRIYLVRHTDTGTERLIRAVNAAQARNHAARDTIDVTVATQDQLVAMLTGGEPVAVEEAQRRDTTADEPTNVAEMFKEAA